MTTIKYSGPIFLRLSSFLTLNRIAIGTYARRIFGIKIEPSWDVNLEIGVRFTRHQFTHAMSINDIQKGRLIFDSPQAETSDKYGVDCISQKSPKGTWFIPHQQKTKASVLYLHGGGYSFASAVSVRFASMLAHHIGAPLFMPDYRLTPEHPHPAQADDACAAWDYVTKDKKPEEIVVIGDSAGGHMMLTLLRELSERGSRQPALGIGLCPWTDIGERGESLKNNNRYDLVQGWMAIRFGQWLDPNEKFGRIKLSPISYDYSKLAPLYLQAGGRENLYDMIIEFIEKQAGFDADILLDVWPNMPHDFQLFDSTRPESTKALNRINLAVRFAMREEVAFPTTSNTHSASGKFT